MNSAKRLPPTPRQQQCLNEIQAFTLKMGVAPTVPELARHLDCTISAARSLIRVLKLKGRLRSDSKRRGLQCIEELR